MISCELLELGDEAAAKVLRQDRATVEDEREPQGSSKPHAADATEMTTRFYTSNLKLITKPWWRSRSRRVKRRQVQPGFELCHEVRAERCRWPGRSGPCTFPGPRLPSEKWVFVGGDVEAAALPRVKRSEALMVASRQLQLSNLQHAGMFGLEIEQDQAGIQGATRCLAQGKDAPNAVLRLPEQSLPKGPDAVNGEGFPRECTERRSTI